MLYLGTGRRGAIKGDEEAKLFCLAALVCEVKYKVTIHGV